MSRRCIILLWAALLMTGLVAVACSDTGTETTVRRVSSPPRTHPAAPQPASADDSKKKKKTPANHDPESLNVAFRVSHVDDAPQIVLDDEDRWAMNNLALIFIEQERYDEAVPPLARAVTLGDDVPSFHNNLGIALEQVGHFSSAAEAYRSALLVDPAYEKASMNLARVEVVRERPTSQPFDLDVVAQRFTDALLAWNVEAVVEP